MNSHSTSVNCTRVTQNDLPDRAPKRGRIPQIDHNQIHALAPFISKARPVRAERPGRGRRVVGGSTRAMGREQSANIRQWAKSRGLPVSERGRIASSLVEQYEAAH
ncbi:histone-like nucleoid-structuring protein Lsr2 [Nonomuraea sp. NPDC049709]|uniref:Lsr2 family DNA-binding protein n=1 Tax=Nonomuraea sp. NPDC049709 TaxID=3154736 RepID=UPI0034266AB1